MFGIFSFESGETEIVISNESFVLDLYYVAVDDHKQRLSTLQGGEHFLVPASPEDHARMVHIINLFSEPDSPQGFPRLHDARHRYARGDSRRTAVRQILK